MHRNVRKDVESQVSNLANLRSRCEFAGKEHTEG